MNILVGKRSGAMSHFLGFDSSTQSLKATLINSDLQVRLSCELFMLEICS